MRKRRDKKQERERADDVARLAFDSVVRTLGGLEGVAKITKRTKPAICNWRRIRGRFPPVLYFDMAAALAGKNIKTMTLEEIEAAAPRALWGFNEAA